MEFNEMSDDQLQKALGLAYNAEALAKKQVAEAKKEWKSRHGDKVGVEYEAEGVSVFLSPNARWDEKTARDVLEAQGLSESVIAKMETTSLDRSKAEEMLPPRIFKMCQKAAAPKVNVRFT